MPLPTWTRHPYLGTESGDVLRIAIFLNSDLFDGTTKRKQINKILSPPSSDAMGIGPSSDFERPESGIQIDCCLQGKRTMTKSKSKKVDLAKRGISAVPDQDSSNFALARVESVHSFHGIHRAERGSSLLEAQNDRKTNPTLKIANNHKIDAGNKNDTPQITIPSNEKKSAFVPFIPGWIRDPPTMQGWTHHDQNVLLSELDSSPEARNDSAELDKVLQRTHRALPHKSLQEIEELYRHVESCRTTYLVLKRHGLLKTAACPEQHGEQEQQGQEDAHGQDAPPAESDDRRPSS